MLLHSQNGRIALLPALPAAWKTGSVQGLRARGGVEVDIDWKDGRLTGYELRATCDGTHEIRLPDGQTKQIRLKKGEQYRGGPQG